MIPETTHRRSSSYLLLIQCAIYLTITQSVVASYNITQYAASLTRGDYSSWTEAALSAEKGLPGGLCPESMGICPPAVYRDPSGICNNVRYPMEGMKGMPFHRLLPPAYGDGISTPRKSQSANPLPPEEAIAQTIRQRKQHEFVTSFLGIWGEFVRRDIAQTVNSENLNCCDGSDHPECFPMVFEDTCKDYGRSLPALIDCSFKQRQQMNFATSYLDGSDLYGSDAEDMRSLRSFVNGHVNIDNCNRCHESSPISSLYILLLQHHNDIATELSKLNKQWDDEELYQEARRIIIAEIQHITYNEFLPIALGDATMESEHLRLESEGFYNGYSSQNTCNTLNEVAHSVLGLFRTMYSNEWVKNGDGVRLSQNELLGNLLATAALYPTTESLDIHREREHGIPDYATVKNFCSGDNGVNINNNNLRELYGYPGDVDLTVGGLLEEPLPGAVFGPTFSCLLINQFSRTRNADRFWYENDLPPSSFTKYQLDSIRRVTLSGILCSRPSGPGLIQPKAFVQSDPYLNSVMSCDLQPKLDLSPWKTEGTNKIPQDMLVQVFQKAEQDVSARRKEEYSRWSHHGGADPKSPVGTAAAFNKATKEALNLANSSLVYEFATEELLQTLHRLKRKKRQLFDTTGADNFLGFPTGFGLNGDFADVLQEVDLTGLITGPRNPEPECPGRDGPEICDELSPFRTHSGYCNNLKNPNLGKSLATFSRLMPPVYENGVSKPRLTGSGGRPLPSPRLVSTMIHADISNLHNRYSLMLMQFSQFLDHDVTFTPVHRGFFASIPDCRSCDSAITVHPECMPIHIPRGDPYYPQINQTSGERVCIAFMRSLPGQQHLGPREQINQNSAFIDAAHIYGEHECQGRELRSGYGGRMNVTRHPVRGKDLLPQSPVHPECKSPSGYCFIAGDGRASEQPGLTVIHTVFMREHNRIAEGLQRVNPHWDDELLYQHARRIVTAAWQHLVYNEYLPRLLGWNAVNLYGLKLRPQGYYTGYSDQCNPNVVNEFATAAFRIGHSLLRPHIPRMGPNYHPVEPHILLRDGFFNPDMIYQANMVDEIIRGLITTPVETLDQFITGEITNHLFEDRRIPFSGIDLAALNIQRGRDHGLHSYNDYRAICNLKKASTFEDLAREIPREVIVRLKRIYASVDDIDLFPGGMSERPVQGGLVGPTFACIIGLQFRQLRKCDRFWYENDDPVTKFTEQQLAEIRKITLSKVLCENMDHPEDIQRSAFDQPSSFLNPRVPCQSLQDINLNAWQENKQGCNIHGRQIAVGGTAVPTPCTSCACTAQGAQCASLRVTDCNQLLREWSKDAVIRDEVCTTQCGFLLHDTTTQPSGLSAVVPEVTFTTNGPPSARVNGGRRLPVNLIPPPFRNQRRSRGPGFTNFKIPPFLTG